MEILSKKKKGIDEIINYHSNKRRVRLLLNAKVDRHCIFEGHNSVGADSILKRCRIGLGSYVGANNYFTNVLIGRFCSIASNIRIVVGKHPTSVFVSTHPSFFSNKTRSAGFTFCKESIFVDQQITDSGWFVEIGNDVWIGDNVTIMSGVKIGDGAIIGACSLVTHDIPPYSICIGTPTRVTKYRFSDPQISFLLKFKWWERDWEWVKKHADLFSNIDSLIESQKV